MMYIRNLAVLLSAVCILPSAGWAQSKGHIIKNVVKGQELAAGAARRAIPNAVRSAGRNSLTALTFERFVTQQIEKGRLQARNITREELVARLNKNTLAKSVVADMQFQVLQTSWAAEEFQLLALKDLPMLPLKHNYSLLPPVQKRALRVYRSVVANYKGASSFAQEKDLESWAQMISAVSNLGFFGGKKDADILVKVYQKVPPQAKKVTALAINRALLSLGAAEENALFSRLAAEDGALSEEFALGMESRTEAAVASAQEEEKMLQAVAKFHPFGTLHFNPSSMATAQWMVLNKSVSRAGHSVDLTEFASWQEGKLAHLEVSSLNEILTRPDSPYFQDLSQQEAANLVRSARGALARKFAKTYPQLAQEVDVYGAALKLDFNGVSNPWETLHDVVVSRKYLDVKRSEFTAILDNLGANVEDFSTARAEFLKLFKQFPKYDWGNLPNRFAEAKEMLPVVRRQAEVRVLNAKNERFASFLEKDVTVRQLRDEMVQFKTLSAQKIYNWKDLPFRFYKKINDVLFAKDTPRALADEKAVEELVGYQVDFYRGAMSVPLYKSKITRAEASTLKVQWERLKNKFPNQANDDISALFEQRIEEDKMLAERKNAFETSEYESFDADFPRWQENFNSYRLLRQTYPDYDFGVLRADFETQRETLLHNALPPKINLKNVDNGEEFIDSESLLEQWNRVSSLAQQYNTRRDECLNELFHADEANLERTLQLRRAELKELYNDVLSRNSVLREDIQAAAAKQKEGFFSRWWKRLTSH